jgi:chemotaxis protein methyltransferase CheR
MPEPKLSPQLFAILGRLVEDACGMHYERRDHHLFAAKVEAHVREVGNEALLDYYYRLRYDDPGGIELARLIEALLVHETYLFRELAPLEQLVDGHLSEVVRSRGRARLWSAACSTGEEPFTMAMLLDARGLLDRVEIVGTDVSAAAVARARAGQHGRRSLRDAYPVELARRYLETCPDGVVVAPRVRHAVRFQTVNLLDEAAVAALGVFDAILCRNVLIYFRDAQIVRVIERIASALAPDGLIAVGVSESLLRFGTALTCEERGRSFFYRRVR